MGGRARSRPATTSTAIESAYDFLSRDERVVRPANYMAGTPAEGTRWSRSPVNGSGWSI